MSWIEIQDDEGDVSVFIQATELKGSTSQSDSGIDRVSRSGNTAKVKAQMQDVKKVVKATNPIIKSIRESLEDINNPKEIEIEFTLGVGVKTSGALAAVIGGSNVDLEFKVRVQWENETKSKI